MRKQILAFVFFCLVAVFSAGAQECVDSETGADPLVSGNINIGSDFFSDNCQSDLTLIEQSCSGDQFNPIKVDVYNCADFGMVCLNSQPVGARCVLACPEGQFHDQQGNCVDPIPECKDGEILNRETRQCEENLIPEFNVIAGSAALIGAGASFLLLRRK